MKMTHKDMFNKFTLEVIKDVCGGTLYVYPDGNIKALSYYVSVYLQSY